MEKGESHEDAGLACRRGAAACRLRRRAAETEPLTISGVTVQADLPAVGSPQAVAYWQNLSDDLETAIAAQFVGRIDPAGKQITVDVDEISLTQPLRRRRHRRDGAARRARSR